MSTHEALQAALPVSHLFFLALGSLQAKLELLQLRRLALHSPCSTARREM